MSTDKTDWNFNRTYAEKQAARDAGAELQEWEVAEIHGLNVGWSLLADCVTLPDVAARLQEIYCHGARSKYYVVRRGDEVKLCKIDEGTKLLIRRKVK